MKKIQDPTKKISIIICARNEEHTIQSVIKRVRNYATEVLVIDGMSKDRTAVIARRAHAKVIPIARVGKGNAVRKGMRFARFPIIVFIDADGSHDPNDIPKLLATIYSHQADMVIASRIQGGSDEWSGTFENSLRKFGTIIITACINLRFNTRMTDSQNGFRAIRKEIALSLGLNGQTTTIEQEMVIKGLKKGIVITEIASHEFARKFGSSHIHVLRNGLGYLWSLGSLLT